MVLVARHHCGRARRLLGDRYFRGA